ncbi:GNAT family N-acetyltransferase [Cellulomonas sp. PhB143]|uniref:GNAT family N-acetyltransferase n=1 Tax=Cellulomonas sp. PhB143 TaxID=2485186 RepID=UPI000F4741E6|nr:GNAT family N-acetyltransferase [Cellulomonas sp. PhB143]ROS79055.1 hypothetical protein EDF32_0101 [Cellulomonas sp. PhB143]
MQTQDAARVLAAYDEQVRRNPAAEASAVVEREGGVVRVVSSDDGWNAVTWADLDGLGARDVGEVIAAQAERFARAGLPWEWKHYSYDQPVDLPVRLVAAGLTREPDETLLVAEIADLDLDVAPPDGVRLDPVEDVAGADALVALHDEVFGGEHGYVGRAVLAGLAATPRSVEAVLARSGARTVSGGRVELHHGTEFASIWGGGTVPDWRGRGVFRAVVAHRARVAADAGFRYLQVDALPTSRPILERLGFHALATTRPFTHA